MTAPLACPQFDGYNPVLVAPEILWPACPHVELKAGSTLGVTSHGEQVGARLLTTPRF